MQADIDLAPAVGARQPQEQDLVGTLARLRRRLGQRVQHGLPGRERRQGAAVERAAGGLDAVARGGVHVVRLLVQAAEQPFAQRGERLGDARQRAGEPLRRLGRHRDRAGRRRIPARPRRSRRAPRRGPAPGGGPGAGTPRSGWAGRRPGRPVRDGRSPMRPDQPGAGSARAACSAASSGVSSSGRAATSSSMPPPQAAGARPAALGAEQPAAQLGGLQPGQLGGERAVRRVEHVVAFVEHVAGGHDAVVQPAPGGLGHHQRMVGDDELRGARAADRVLDEAAPPVRAGGVDALAAPVGEAEDRSPVPNSSASQPGRSPPWMSPSSVASAQRAIRPSGMTDGRRQPRRRGAERVLQVQQAEVVLAALAHHDAPAPVGGIGEQARQLGVDLALQMAGEGADPDGAVVLLRPQAGGREIAERLAGAGAGLGQHQMRIAAGLARREGGGGGAGVVGLARPLLGVRSQHRGEPRPRLGLRHRMRRRRRQRCRVLPLRQALPDPQRLARRRRVRPAERGRDERRPAPAGLAHAGREPRGVAVQRSVAALREPMQQRGGQFGQQRGLGFQPAVRRLEVERQGEAARRRRGGARRQREGEQLQQIEGRHAAQAEPAERRRRMHQQRRRQAAQMRRRPPLPATAAVRRRR